MSRKLRNKPPLDQAALRDLALTYVARYATTRAKLTNYLHRKIRERGVAEEERGLDVEVVTKRLVELRYIDDAAYAQSRAAGLLNKGFGARRVDQSLRAAGVDEATRNEFAPDEFAKRQSASRLARKRGFGPFSRDFGSIGQIDRNKREKQIAAMVRAGHDFSTAIFLIDAANVEDIEQWIDEAEEWQNDD